MKDQLDGVFSHLEPQPADALLGIIAMLKKDPRPGKIDLGIGVFRDEAGETPILRAVKAAEAELLANQNTKTYLGPAGDELYTELLARQVLGDKLAASDRITGIQAPGGTGALRLGAALLAAGRPGATIWISDPTWPNHAPVFAAAGLTVRTHRFYQTGADSVDFDGMISDLAAARPGDILLLHGCCHNPTGAGFTADQWSEITAFCNKQGLVPFIDLAYQGVGDGLEADAAATRSILESVPVGILAYSCNKNFGLYRERVGALWVAACSAAETSLVRGNVLALVRCLWSMPPDHGAAIVRTILQSDKLRADWELELNGMRDRVNGLRESLAASLPRLAAIGRQRGMFAMLPITPADVVALREQHGIYMAGNGRINIAGLTRENLPKFVECLCERMT